MAQTSNGSITITDLTDITDVYLEYCMAADSITTAAAIIAKTIWTPPEREWSTEYPTWQSGYQIWIREVTKKEGIAQLEYGTPYLDKAVNQINNNISNIQTKIKKIWSDSTGSYMASGIGGNDVTESNVNTYGFNSKSTTTGISFNYNAIPLTSLGTDGLKLYSPVLTNSVITGNRLDATLTSEGLKLLRGGIEGGNSSSTAGNNGYVYLSTLDKTGITINGHTPGTNDPKWRAIIGSKFGVDSEGNLYANEAHISGAITATSLQVDGLGDFMSFMTFEDGVLKITKPGFNYSVEIHNDGVYIVDPNNHAIASYKDYITLGTKDGNSIDIRSDSINFNIGDETFAYVAQDKWFTSNAEVSGAMYIGDYSLKQNSNGDFVLGRRR